MLDTNFELYKIFYVTAKCGNITLAAQRLFLTQPSVTKYIQKLEQHLGCALFVRSKRGVTLTAEGRMLMSRIEPACQLILSGERELSSRQALESGTISIVSTEMSFKSYVLPTMENFLHRHPGIRVRFANALNEQMVEMLSNGGVDIAILHEPFRREDFMDIRVIEEMDEYAVCGRPFIGLSKRVNSPGDLISLPFISMPEGSSTMEYLTQYFARFGLEFKPDIELTTVELTAQAVEGGLGIGILPKRIAEPRIRSGSIFRVPVDPVLPKRKACLITNSLLPPGIAAQVFADELLSKNQG